MITSLRVGRLAVPVIVDCDLKDDDGEALLGHYINYGDPEIRVRRLERPLDYRTLFHEALHALSELYGVDLNENQTRALEHLITDLLADNPELSEALCPPR